MPKIAHYALLAGAFLTSPAFGQDADPPQFGPVLGALVERLEPPWDGMDVQTRQCPGDNGQAVSCPTVAPEDYAPTLVLDAGVPLPVAVEAYGRPVQVLSVAQARDEQRAFFISIRSVSQIGDGVRVVYGQWATAHSGHVDLVREGEKWLVKDQTRSHSSSGARYAYGEMYDGVVCRDGTEMAERWSRLQNLYRLTRSGVSLRAALDAPVSKVCPGPEFPEAAIFREMRDRRGS